MVCLQDALLLKEDCVEILHLLAEIYYDKEDFDKSLECLEKSLSNPNLDDREVSLQSMASIFFQKKWYEQALPLLSEALQI